ncbi:MAG: hypothetical protein HYX92_03175 [Chloroflexi bacterium]|nr:hypothetical protein [Chloroflexota bacterium]
MASSSVLTVVNPVAETAETMFRIQSRLSEIRGSSIALIGSTRPNSSLLLASLKKVLLEAGAGLDVTEKEPLPPDSELWDIPNVLLSCHIAGSGDRRSQNQSRFFCENLKRYLNGEPLVNVVSRERGY